MYLQFFVTFKRNEESTNIKNTASMCYCFGYQKWEEFDKFVSIGLS